MKIERANAILKFAHLEVGLEAKDEELKGFTIAGANKIFHLAPAKIVGDTIVVNAAEVPQPVAVLRLGERAGREFVQSHRIARVTVLN
jgi:sialate O-acetylesterase